MKKKKKRTHRRAPKVFFYMMLILSMSGGFFYATQNLKLDQPLTFTIQGETRHLNRDQLILLLQKETNGSGFLSLDTNQLSNKVMETNLYTKVKIEKTNYRHIDVVVEEKNFVAKRQNEVGKISVLDDNGNESEVPTPIRLAFISSDVTRDDAIQISQSLGTQTSLLTQQISEITYAFVGESEKEIKMITIEGDIIFIKLKDIRKKIGNFMEINTLMNAKNIVKCEFHFEYNNENVVVKEIK